MKLSRRQFDLLYRLIQVGTSPPSAGGSTKTPKHYVNYALNTSLANGLALGILQELPPHADKCPEDMEEVLVQAEEFLKELGDKT